MGEKAEYARGYTAGKRKSVKQIAGLVEEIHSLRINVSKRKERIYMQCLDLALRHCSDWRIDKKKINDSQGYCTLAKVFADNSISALDER